MKGKSGGSEAAVIWSGDIFYEAERKKIVKFNRREAVDFTEKMIRTGVVREGFYTDMMKVFSPELLELEEDYSRFRYPVKDWQRNALRALQGGIQAGMIDNSIGLTMIPRCGGVVSVSMDISYLLPIGENVDYVEIKTTAENIGEAIAYAHAEIFLPDGSKATDAVSNLMRIPS